MAPTTAVSKEELSGKLVQEISKGDEIPEKFIEKESIGEAVDAPDELWNDTLLIDFSLLSSFDQNELAKLKSALVNWGVFQVINHGIESSFLEEMIEVFKQFFGLPTEEKLKYSGNGYEGFGSDQGFVARRNWNDRLYLTLYPEEVRQLQLWPQKPLKFREILNEYGKKLGSLIEGISKAMGRSLDLEENSFFNQIKGGSIGVRLNMYPPCSSPERVLGVHPHSDGSAITVLLQEQGVESLQIEKDDQWFKVPPNPGALFINLGDLGTLMSNGLFKNVIHRVVTNSTKDRVSCAAFCYPNGGIQIEPISGLINADRPQLYRKITMAEFGQKYLENYAAGRSTFDVLKL